MNSLTEKFAGSKHKYKIIFLIISLLLYGNTLKNGYSLDDEFVTGPESLSAQGFKAIPKVFKTYHVTDESGNNYEYRPIVKVTYAIEYGLWGENLMLSHLVNVLLYALCLMVLFDLLKHLFKEANEFIIFFIVLVFAFLPVHTEVVASLKNRDVILSFIFSFYAFTNVILYLETKKKIRLVLMVASFGLAFLSKFDVVPLVAIIPLILIKKYKVSVKFILTLFFLFIVSFFVYKVTKGLLLDRKAFVAQRVYQYFENPLYFPHAFINNISAGLNSLGFYIKMLFWPSKMACYYGYNTLPVFSFTSVYALLGLIAFVLLGREFVRGFKKPDMLWYGIVIFVGFISMYLNVAVAAAGVVADRFMFFSSVGFSIMFVYLFLKYTKAKPKITGLRDLSFSQKAIPAVLFAICFFVIINRNAEWKSKSELFEADVKKYPESVKLSLLTTSQLIINLSNPEKSKNLNNDEKVKKIRLGEEQLRKAIQTDSSCGGCYNNLSFMYLTYERDPSSALPYLQLAYKRDTTKKEVICNLGIAYFRLGQTDIAKKYLLLSIEKDKKKDFTVPYEVLQDLYSRTNINEGLKYFYKRLQENPNSELFNVLMGKTCFEARDTANSIKYYKTALMLNPNNIQVNDFVTNLEVKFSKKNW